MADLQQNYREFLENPYYAVVTTLRSDGSAHSTVVWVDVVVDGVSINNTRTRIAGPARCESRSGSTQTGSKGTVSRLRNARATRHHQTGGRHEKR